MISFTPPPSLLLYIVARILFNLLNPLASATVNAGPLVMWRVFASWLHVIGNDFPDAICS